MGRKNLVKFLDSLDEEKIETTKKFFKFYKECFGEPDMQNWVYRTILVQTLMKIWLANKEDFKEAELIKVFREIEENATIKHFKLALLIFQGFIFTKYHIVTSYIQNDRNKHKKHKGERIAG